MADVPFNIDLKKWLKFVIPATGVLVLGGMLFTSKSDQLKVSKANGGECIMAPPESVVSVLEKRPCNDTHDAEIVAAFEYPAVPQEGEPTPEQNCLNLVPEGSTPEDVALYEQAIDILVAQGYPNMVVTNNADTTKKRDYVCLITFPIRTTSYGNELFTSLQPTTVP